MSLEIYVITEVDAAPLIPRVYTRAFKSKSDAMLLNKSMQYEDIVKKIQGKTYPAKVYVVHDIDSEPKRTKILLHVLKEPDEIRVRSFVYRDLNDALEKEYSLKVEYVLRRITSHSINKSSIDRWPEGHYEDTDTAITPLSYLNSLWSAFSFGDQDDINTKKDQENDKKQLCTKQFIPNCTYNTIKEEVRDKKGNVIEEGEYEVILGENPNFKLLYVHLADLYHQIKVQEVGLL